MFLRPRTLAAAVAACAAVAPSASGQDDPPPPAPAPQVAGREAQPSAARHDEQGRLLFRERVGFVPTDPDTPLVHAVLQGPFDADHPADPVLAAIGPCAGLTVADVGCGHGSYTRRIADRVGPKGTVLARDIDPRGIASVARRVRDEERGRVDARVSDPGDVKIEPGTADVALLCQMFHYVLNDSGGQQDEAGFLRTLRAALVPGGIAVVVSWHGGALDPARARNEFRRAATASFVSHGFEAGRQWLLDSPRGSTPAMILEFRRPLKEKTPSVAPGSSG